MLRVCFVLENPKFNSVCLFRSHIFNLFYRKSHFQKFLAFQVSEEEECCIIGLFITGEEDVRSSFGQHMFMSSFSFFLVQSEKDSSLRQLNNF